MGYDIGNRGDTIFLRKIVHAAAHDGNGRLICPAIFVLGSEKPFSIITDNGEIIDQHGYKYPIRVPQINDIRGSIA